MKTSLRNLHILPVLIACLAQTAHAAVTLSVTPAAVSNTYSGFITLQVAGLNSGESVVVQKFLDLNTNGVIDAGDWLVQQFNLTNLQAGMKIGGIVNSNVPGDTGSTPGQITAQLNFQNGDFMQNIIGQYLYKVSSPSGRWTPLTNLFTVTNFPYAQKLAGNVFSNGTSTTVPNAVVLLFPAPIPGNNGPGGKPLAGVVANNAGGYAVQMPPGTYLPMAFSSNYVANYVTSPVPTLNSGQTLTTNLALINATASITGKSVDANNASLPLPGVLMPAESTNGLIAATFSDTNGNFTLPVTAGQWAIGVEDTTLTIHGYVGLDNGINANAGATNVTLPFPKATALIYGSVKDSFGNPVAGFQMESDDQNYIYYAGGITDTNGNYFVGALGGLAGVTWEIEPPDGNFNSDYQWILNPPDPWSTISSNTAWLVNFTAITATNTISGKLTDNYGNPIGGIEMFADATISDVFYHLYQVNTDSGGNYRINVCNGSWTFGVDDYSDQFDYPPLSNYICPANQMVVIANNNAVANFTATNLCPLLSAPQVTVGSTNFTFQLSGPAGSNYVLQVSTNLVNWSSVSTSTMPVSGNMTLTNALSGYSRRFYRAYMQ